jgi:wyosine [tRNA(Phe)-imidazoG37] synthetase (radical SAM superfamily)
VGPCNHKCTYCNLQYFDHPTYNPWKFFPSVFLQIETEKLLDKDKTTVVVCNGEFSIGPDGNRLVELARPYFTTLVTNANIFSVVAATALKDSAIIYTSLDAGRGETYKKIHGVDGFNEVCNNLKRYSEYGSVMLKYLVLDGVNDNDNDIGAFFQLADDIATKVIISRDFFSDGVFSDYTLSKVAKFIKHFQSNGKMSKIVGYNRGDESQRLQKFLEELQNDK